MDSEILTAMSARRNRQVSEIEKLQQACREKERTGACEIEKG